MPNILNACVQSVKNLGMSQRITSAWQSTVIVATLPKAATLWVKHLFIGVLSPISSPQYSTGKFALLPLIEHYLYPVSTGPTTIITKEIN